MKCAQVRELFGAYWDDEITQGEREWIESHFAGCPACREEYEGYARTLELVGSLPREEAAPDLLERVLARTRRAAASPDRLPIPRAAWVPVTAAAALAMLVIAALSPWMPIRPRATKDANPATPAPREAVAILTPARTGESRMPGAASHATSRGGSLVADSLFDHSEDVDFILDPGTVRRGHVRPVSPHPSTVQGERAVISF